MIGLTEMGFSVWESQLEKEQGRGVTPEDMQHGVQNAAVVVLLLTPGIFHAERHFVWKTEIKYALEIKWYCRKFKFKKSRIIDFNSNQSSK